MACLPRTSLLALQSSHRQPHLSPSLPQLVPLEAGVTTVLYLQPVYPRVAHRKEAGRAVASAVAVAAQAEEASAVAAASRTDTGLSESASARALGAASETEPTSVTRAVSLELLRQRAEAGTTVVAEAAVA